ncbi:MAG: 30S ribosomal protein S16 [Planctomycetes bacterium]|nr:30S ribosomal protein S16 [Planctomycetota bacterium]
MSVLIRMSRIGRKNRPSYRISVADDRYPLDGRVIEDIGVYDPLAPRAEMRMKVDPERAKHWLGTGARVSDTVRSVFNKLGVSVPVPKRRHRTGRVATKTRGHKLAAKATRVELKAQRRVARLAARKAAKAAAGDAPADPKAAKQAGAKAAKK